MSPKTEQPEPTADEQMMAAAAGLTPDERTAILEICVAEGHRSLAELAASRGVEVLDLDGLREVANPPAPEVDPPESA